MSLFPGIMPIPSPRYRPNAVHFDGSNDYLRRVGGLTGAADSKQLVLSTWLRKTTTATGLERIFCSFTSLAGGATAFKLRFLTNDTNQDLNLYAEDGAGNVDLLVGTSANVFKVADGWIHFLLSVDMADTGKRHLYLSDVSDLNVDTYNNDTLDMTLADWSVGALADGTQKYQGDIADFMFWAGSYIDFSVEANRRLFISSEGKPVHPATAISVLGTPIIHFGNPLATWPTNLGSGGGFTLTGTLTEASTNPAD